MQFSNPKAAFAYTALQTFVGGDAGRETLASLVKTIFPNGFDVYAFDDSKKWPSPDDADLTLSYTYFEEVNSDYEETCKADVYIFRAKGLIIVMWENGESDYLIG
ncbi:hypothetical protein [Serratia phage SMP]|uniref:Uncharacterized protein n=1 Tax=Serratia phage SMP TaxID=2982904 RepID=A0A9E8JZX4_9CAUD|nr:hypothetical protein [Serratia phage SMP]